MEWSDRIKKSWKGYFRLIGLILFVVILSRLELDRLVGIISRTNWAYLLIAILINLPHFFIKAYRWRCLLKIQNIEYSVKDSFLAYMGSMYFGFLTPGRFGEMIKVFHLRKDKAVSASRGMPSVIIDRVFDVYILVLVGPVGLWKFGLLEKVSSLVFPGIALLAVAPFLFLNKKIMDRLVKILHRLVTAEKFMGKLGAYYEEFYESVRELVSWRLFLCGLLTAAAYFLFFLQCYCIARSLQIMELSFTSIVFIMAITSLVTMVPVSVAGLGTRDAILIYLFSLQGIGKEMAVGFSLIIFFTFYIAGGLMGLLCWVIKPIDVKR